VFQFLQYIQPSWYYNLAHKTKVPIFPSIADLSEQDRAILTQTNAYDTELARQTDIAYQALQKGFILNKQKTRLKIQESVVTDIKDNYRFTQRYFGWVKAFYILIIRVCTFHNPLKEAYAFLLSFRIPKINVFEHHKNHKAFFTFESPLLKEKPLVSIVIPTLNRYPFLKDVLADLEKQTYHHFEVLVCDQSEPVDDSFYVGWKLNLTLIKQPEKALWLARNQCIQAAQGDYILLFDDDSRVVPDWIEQHLRCIDYFGATISAGVTHTLVGHGLSIKESYFHLSDVFDTGNAMVKRNVFASVGLFDRQFERQRMGDGEFGLRALLGGFPSISNPFAKRIHLKVETGGLRQMGSWDALRPKNLLAPRPVPSVLYFIRKYFGNKQAILFVIQNVLFSFIPYKFKKSKLLKYLSLSLVPILLPIILWTTGRSWLEATNKLKQGPIIPSTI
jgi:GT2 family glycosyltransferase